LLVDFAILILLALGARAAVARWCSFIFSLPPRRMQTVLFLVANMFMDEEYGINQIKYEITLQEAKHNIRKLVY
jgi:hypothetical protein